MSLADVCKVKTQNTMTYKRTNNWGNNGSFYNGRGDKIRNPAAYFEAVAENRHVYNDDYANGYGHEIYNPEAYFKKVVATPYQDRGNYTYNKFKKRSR